MKKVFLLTLASTCILAVSCKKGPIKPGKLDGTWSVDKIDEEINSDYVYFDLQDLENKKGEKTTIVKYDGNIEKVISLYTKSDGSVDYDKSDTTEKTISVYEYVFDKDGNVTMTKTYTSEEKENDGSKTEYQVTETNKGYWNIQNKYNPEYLKNERIGIEWVSVVRNSTEMEYNADGDLVKTTSGTTNLTENYSGSVDMWLVTEFDKESMTTSKDLGQQYTYTETEKDEITGNSDSSNGNVPENPKTGSRVVNFTKLAD